MKIYLLTHPREIFRNNNTGKLLLQIPQVETQLIHWQRDMPDPQLLASIAQGSTALLYPNEGGTLLTSAPSYDNYIVLDGTWQEARKIYNKSSYLKLLPIVTINSDRKSIYQLRRNQKAEGLCTAESVIEILHSENATQPAEQLSQMLQDFINEQPKG